MQALDAAASRCEWRNGRGLDAIAALRVLAGRLGYPVGALERR